MLGFIVFIHIIISILLIIAILMQSSKGGGLAGVMGGDAMGAVFGGRGAATFLSRVTTILALAFAFSCMLQVFISKSRFAGQQSVIQQELGRTTTTTPASSLPGLPAEAQQSEAATAQPDTTR